jgi:YfiH family protein
VTEPPLAPAELVGDDGTPVGLPLGPAATAWFTGAELPGITDANLAHHRPHLPPDLAAARTAVGRIVGADPAEWHLMRQVHGAAVGLVRATTPLGAELRDVDALVTAEPGRVLVVLAADCLPVLIGGSRTIAAVHAGWRGLEADVIGRTVAALAAEGEDPAALRVIVGPSIGACCYEVGTDVARRMAAIEPGSVRSPDDAGRPHVDLGAVARRRFAAVGVGGVVTVDACTRCGPGRWFSHRRDPGAGRQAGLIVLAAA